MKTWSHGMDRTTSEHRPASSEGKGNGSSVVKSYDLVVHYRIHYQFTSQGTRADPKRGLNHMRWRWRTHPVQPTEIGPPQLPHQLFRTLLAQLTTWHIPIPFLAPLQDLLVSQNRASLRIIDFSLSVLPLSNPSFELFFTCQ